MTLLLQCLGCYGEGQSLTLSVPVEFIEVNRDISRCFYMTLSITSFLPFGLYVRAYKKYTRIVLCAIKIELYLDYS
jgi:hypothetical protein